MKRCGLLGEKLGHSYSPAIHAELADYEYRLYEVAPEKLGEFLTGGGFDGMNVTIPYKKAVIPYCAELSPIAQKLQSVNVLVRREDGTLYGDNADAYGFAGMVRASGIEIEGKKGEETKTVKVKEIADVEDAQSLSSINRLNQTRYISVSAKVKDGYTTTSVSNKVKKTLDQIDLPEGYSIEYNGENETVMESMKQVILMLVLALAFMYLIMVAQFQSLKGPFIIMFTIPLAFTGGFAALFFAGKDVSIIAMIGMVMLCGVIVNNGIVFVDSVNQLREEGLEIRDAIVLTGKNRLRPIVMTALTTILGLSTMAMGIGMGADMAQPMALVVIGGLIYGTILTLAVVPCIYESFYGKRNKIHNKKKPKVE